MISHRIIRPLLTSILQSQLSWSSSSSSCIASKHALLLLPKCASTVLSKHDQLRQHQVQQYCQISNSASTVTPTSVESAETKAKQARIERQNKLFNEHRDKQRSLIKRIEKMEVHVTNVMPSPDLTLLMNKDISTPLDCAAHLGELFVERSVLATVDDQLWDIVRPLPHDCTLTFQHFKQENTFHVNNVFWRSCSFLLGKVIEEAFKDDVQVNLHSWPPVNPVSGSFVYDVHLPTLDDWHPTVQELLTLTRMFTRLTMQQCPFEHLQLNLEHALDLFRDCSFKIAQLSSIAETKPDKLINVYRVDKHIDFSIGPMLPHTGHIGRVEVTAVHQLNSSISQLYRVQGVAVPTQLPTQFYSFKLMCERAAKLNPGIVP